ncbi:MAG: hypothetical protein Q9227_003157 [Pyrenula ochraceoflavens]
MADSGGFEGMPDIQEFAGEPKMDLGIPQQQSYPDRESLKDSLQTFAREHGYGMAIKTSSRPDEKKSGRAAKLWLRCDRGGTYRPRNGLTEETRKRKRTSRLTDCQFLIIATGQTENLWTFEVIHPFHNHGPYSETPHRPQPMKDRAKKGQLEAAPYHWPHEPNLGLFTTALVVIDMQRDYGGYLSAQGIDPAPCRAVIPKISQLLEAFRKYQGFHIYFTREGHRPSLATLPEREKYRSTNNLTHIGIGDQTQLGRALIRGELGHEIMPELQPLEDEEIIDKPARGAFAHTELELILRTAGIKNLILVGVTTDVCVSTTMREASDRGFECLLVEDACAAATTAAHTATVESVKGEGGIFGAVSKVQDVLQAVDGVMARSEKRVDRINTVNGTPITPVPQMSHPLSTMSTPVDAHGYVPIDPNMTGPYPES